MSDKFSVGKLIFEFKHFRSNKISHMFTVAHRTTDMRNYTLCNVYYDESNIATFLTTHNPFDRGSRLVGKLQAFKRAINYTGYDKKELWDGFRSYIEELKQRK